MWSCFQRRSSRRPSERQPWPVLGQFVGRKVRYLKGCKKNDRVKRIPKWFIVCSRGSRSVDGRCLDLFFVFYVLESVCFARLLSCMPLLVCCLTLLPTLCVPKCNVLGKFTNCNEEDIFPHVGWPATKDYSSAEDSWSTNPGLPLGAQAWETL